MFRREENLDRTSDGEERSVGVGDKSQRIGAISTRVSSPIEIARYARDISKFKLGYYVLRTRRSFARNGIISASPFYEFYKVRNLRWRTFDTF